VSALRRCRRPVPARVAIVDNRPVRVTTDRRGFAGGMVVHAAGPWRSSGEWWTGQSGKSGGSGREESSSRPTHQANPAPWDVDEWDVSLNDGGVYRIFQDRVSEAWFVDAIVD
jgi:protein ImuB